MVEDMSWVKEFQPRGIRAKPAFGERVQKRVGSMVNPTLSPSMQDKMIAYLHGVTERDRALAERERKLQAEERAKIQAEEREEALAKVRDQLNAESVRKRCEDEMGQEPPWRSVTLQNVTDGHNKPAKGIFYGLEFPWSEETLEEFGPAWLTKALHAAGTLATNNEVIAINVEKKLKITAGNNGGKFLFEVKYARQDPELHTKLFAKVPFPMTAALKTDRLSSSVYKQPMDYAEINTYRLYESALPFKTPKYYYGDISNETTNFILILERLNFASMGNGSNRPIKPYQIEGPYDKCKDYQLSNAKEYYAKIMACIGHCAGAQKAGKFGTDADIVNRLSSYLPSSRALSDWGCNPSASSGAGIRDVITAITSGYNFIAKTAKVLYPAYVTTATFEKKFKRVMMTVSAYRAEIEYYKNLNVDYMALGHQNMNMDNAYFWRDEHGVLDCGGLDWGGFGIMSLAHKVWWSLNCADFDNTSPNLDEYIDIVLNCYEESGGPKLDRVIFRKQLILTALQNFLQMVNSVPNCMRMCPAREWQSISDRYDSRIAGDIDGKSTLRTTIHVLGVGIRVLEEMRGDEVLAKWIDDYYAGELGLTPKSDEMIGLADAGLAPDLPYSMERRCKEAMKVEPPWVRMDMGMVTAGHSKVAKGMFYGLEFPYSEETLQKFGPEWLTKALHAAGTLAKDNAVTEIIVETKVKITAGNNGGKFLFEVRYEREDPELHTKMFAKVPFPMTPALKTDRLSSSVLKQPMDYAEINTYRLYEAALPFKTPKYYYGDISNETSNFILILGRLDFSGLTSTSERTIEPYQIEGPYDKCKDYQLSNAKEYYSKIMACLGYVAGAQKAGKFGSDDDIARRLGSFIPRSRVLKDWGCDPSAHTGGNAKEVLRTVGVGYTFIGETARVLYPAYVTTAEFRQKYTRVMMTISAYQAEINYYKHQIDDSVVLGHQNMNMDNAYFWRDENGVLDCGGLDWGGFGMMSLAHKVWWSLNCADYDNTSPNLDYYIDIVLNCCEESGGPKLDRTIFRKQVILTGLQNLLQMVNAVPNSMRMCKTSEWPTIKDRHDPRIAGDIDGKSTLRTTIHVIGVGLRLMEEMQGDKVLEDWINDYYAGELGLTPKSDATIGLA